MDKTLVIGEEIKTVDQGFKVLQVEANIENVPTCDSLWKEIEDEEFRIRQLFTMPEINKREAIAATRYVYKALGKDPNRYRPSAESLCRRCVKGIGLYRLTTAVDIINLISMHTGYSIGGFDRDLIQGDELTLGVGLDGEVFNAIGRGTLNICGLPVWRDNRGGIGTPTSDEERTKLTETTRRILMIFNMYGNDAPIDKIADMTQRLLEHYACAEEIEMQIID